MGSSDVDFSIDGKTTQEVEEELAHMLRLKGYCVLDMGLGEKLDDVVADIKDLQGAGRFERPPAEVVQGLLGPDGSQELAWVSLPSAEAHHEGEALWSLHQDLQWLAECTRHFYEGDLALEGMRRSQMMVLRGGAPEEEEEEREQEDSEAPETGRGPPALTEESCSFWMGLFASVKLMLLCFAGPGEGRLELQTFDEESGTVTINTRPDMVVILRCDSLSHTHVSTASDYAICSWVAAPNSAGTRGWNCFNTGAMENIPGLHELCEWTDERLMALMHLEVQEKLEDVPRSWQRMMRATYFKNSNLPVAIRGASTHSPGSNDCDLLWKTLNNGIDYLQVIPHLRWDHTPYYDPDPNCWMQSATETGGWIRTSVQHAQFIDGVDLFDNKFFQISQSEATGMEPQQRHILETSYEALRMAGYTKKALMNAYIAVFSGSTHPEAAYVPYPGGAGAGNLSQAIVSNRTSFVLGCMGPSTSIDCEMASASMALMVGCSAVAPNNAWRTQSGGDSDAAITGGVHINVAGPYMWPRFHAYMNPMGRCFAFDECGNGYVRGECCMSVVQKKYTENVDGEWVVPDELLLGTIVGYRMTNNGSSASLTAPHAASQQEVVHDAIQLAGIDALDLDAIECHGVGGLLEDSVEVSAYGKLLRTAEGSEFEPLVLSSVKTNLSAQCEASGMTAFVKVMYNILYAAHVSNLHLKQLNPHIVQSESLIMHSEALPYRDNWSFHGVSSRGWGGINTHIIQWCQVDPERVRTDKLELLSEPFSFWPGGGGMLEREARPSEGYFIVGSWNNWKPEEMQRTEEGFVYTVTLGMNRFETFQIWLDGDSNRVLHPSMPRAPSACAMRGPVQLDQANGLNWLIDGRVVQQPVAAPADPAAPSTATDTAEEHLEVSTRDRGRVGDKYEVKLSVAGKYRAVSWWKTARGADDAELRTLQGTYYVIGSYNKWKLDEMTPDEDAVLGLHTLEIGPLDAGTHEFQIVRNRAWDQRFHPQFSTMAAESWDEYEVCGPDDEGHMRNWCIKARKGDVFRIEFQRSLGNGVDMKRISWRSLRPDERA